MAKTETNLILLGIIAVISILFLVFLFKLVITGASIKSPYWLDRPVETHSVYAQQQTCKMLAAQHTVPAQAVMPASTSNMASYGAGNCFATGIDLPQYCCVIPRPA